MTLLDAFSEAEIDLLRQRAARAAALVREQDGGDLHNALSLLVWGEHYAVPIDQLMAVYGRIRVRRVPCSPPTVCGVANVRGRILPVMELALLLNAASQPDDDAEGVIVAGNESMTVAFRVQRIGDVLTYTDADLEPVAATSDLASRTHVRAILPDGTALLDMDAILADPALEVNQTAN